MDRPAFRVLLTGATGFAGGGVLSQCLADPRIMSVTVLGRRPVGRSHAKLLNVVLEDFIDQSAVGEHFDGLDVVFFCLGISQSDVPDPVRYRTITYEYTMETARRMKARCPDAVMHFLSGAGTKVTSRLMWARVKGEAERDLSTAGLGGAVHYRPALVVGERGMSSRYRAERLLRPLEPLYRPLRGLSLRASELGQAMIQATVEGTTSGTFENRDIRDLADRYGLAG